MQKRDEVCCTCTPHPSLQSRHARTVSHQQSCSLADHIFVRLRYSHPGSLPDRPGLAGRIPTWTRCAHATGRHTSGLVSSAWKRGGRHRPCAFPRTPVRPGVRTHMWTISHSVSNCSGSPPPLLPTIPFARSAHPDLKACQAHYVGSLLWPTQMGAYPATMFSWTWLRNNHMTACITLDPW